MNRESERKRLVELLYKVQQMRMMRQDIWECADFLIDNGIVVPPVKVGDKMWLISENGSYVYDTDVEIVFCDRDGCYIETIQNDVFIDEDFGKTVFLTKEEAEKKRKTHLAQI